MRSTSQGYTDAQVRAMIDGLLVGSGDMSRDVREVVRDEPLMRGRLLELLRDGPLTVPELAAAGGFPRTK